MVVINWNGARWLEQMTISLKEQTLQPVEKILVDNGSSDRSESIPEHLYPGWKILRNKTNRGFAAAANMGINRSTQPYILLLNTDCVLSRTYCEKLLAALTLKPDAGGAMGFLKRPDGQTIDSLGIKRDHLRRRPLDVKTDQAVADVSLPNTAVQVFALNASAALYRRAMFDSIEFEQGFFDENYVSYFEDVDVCWRARNLGWKFFCIPTAEAVHVRGGSAALQQKYFQIRAYANRFRLYLLHEKVTEFLLLLPYNLGLELFRIVLKPLIQPYLFSSILILLASLPDILYRRRYDRIFKPVISPASLGPFLKEKGSHGTHPKQKRDRVRTIIVNYNTGRLLFSCLESLQISQSSHSSIVVVDNASEDGSPELIKKHFPAVEIIEFTQNKGFATAINAGINSVPADHYLLLNSDTVAPPGFIPQLLKLMDQFPSAGILGPCIRNPDGSVQISWGARPTLKNEFLQRKLHQKYSQNDPDTCLSIEKLYARNRSVDWVSGACLLIRNETVAHIGLMDERFFLYYEDIDWCLRAKYNGWQVIYCPHLSLLHLGGASAAQTPLSASQHYRNSQHLFYKKHFSSLQQCGLKLFFLFKGKNLYSQSKFEKPINP